MIRLSDNQALDEFCDELAISLINLTQALIEAENDERYEDAKWYKEIIDLTLESGCITFQTLSGIDLDIIKDEFDGQYQLILREIRRQYDSL